MRQPFAPSPTLSINAWISVRAPFQAGEGDGVSFILRDAVPDIIGLQITPLSFAGA
jgi:hypothetical protein